MTITPHQKAGAAIAILAAIAAVVGIVIGTGVARGKFSGVPNATKRN